MKEGFAAKELWTKFDKKYRLLAGSADHDGGFEVYLNGHQNIPPSSPQRDQALLIAIEQGQWGSELFEDEKTHLSALQLFLSGKIHWSQKATISDVIETQRVYGLMIPCPILTKEGDFTQDAQCFLHPFLFKGMDKIPLNDQELAKFKALIQALPLSERFFFLYPEQEKDIRGSRPSPHNKIRDEIASGDYPFLRLLNVEDFRNKKHPDKNPNTSKLCYCGVIRLSFGAENALGLVDVGIDAWYALIPRMGARQDIDDVERLALLQARLTISGESRVLGLADDLEDIHDVKVPYPDLLSHDDFHRKAYSAFPPNVRKAIEKIINNTREMFRFYWSADIWLLRDSPFFGVVEEAKSQIASAKSEEERTTRLLDSLLHSLYSSYQTRNCSASLQKALDGSLILFDEKLNPKQIVCYFIVDLAMNPSAWRQFNISDNEDYYQDPYPDLIACAKFLKNNGLFTHNMKANILKFECVTQHIRNDYSPPTTMMGAGFEKLKEIDQHLDEYVSQRNNTLLYLGFSRKKIGRAVQPQDAKPRSKARCKLGKVVGT